MRLVEHAMLGHVERKHRRSVAQHVAEFAEQLARPGGVGADDDDDAPRQALALATLYEQVRDLPRPPVTSRDLNVTPVP